LEHGEYFGIINLNDLVSDMLYDWIETRKPTGLTQAQIEWNPKLELTKGWEPCPKRDKKKSKRKKIKSKNRL
jgi:hypothetical protein